MYRFDCRLLGLPGLMLVALVGCQLNPGPRRMQIAARQLQWGSLDHGNRTRTFAYYMPADLPDSPAPVVILLHGGGQNAHNTWAFEAGQRWKTLAGEHQFIVVLPEGQADRNNADSHHWNDCRTGATSPDLAITNRNSPPHSQGPLNVIATQAKEAVIVPGSRNQQFGLTASRRGATSRPSSRRCPTVSRPLNGLGHQSGSVPG